LDPRIISGQAAALGKFPFVVHLFSQDYPKCGGVLIAYSWIVTAAHCVAGKGSNSQFEVVDKDTLKVGYGTTKGGEIDTVGVKNIYVHPGFNPVTFADDIAVLQLKATIQQTLYTRSVVISSDTIKDGQTLTAIGWGATSNGSGAQSDALMYTNMVTAPSDKCKNASTEFNGQNGSLICTSAAASHSTGICRGDSGGPLVAAKNGSYKLVGLVSFDINEKDAKSDLCAVEGLYSYFTNVRVHVNFISLVTGIPVGEFVDGDVSQFRQSYDGVLSASLDKSDGTETANIHSINQSSSSEASPVGSDSKKDDSADHTQSDSAVALVACKLSLI
ncbi:hypothetical protein EV182_005428, partial [Spiromyces aspiralis]